MTPPRGVVLIALAMLGTAGCAGTPPRLGLSWPYQPSREASNQRTTSSPVTTDVPSLTDQSLEPVNVWPEPNSAWFTHPLSTISKLWIGSARTTLSGVDPVIRASSDMAWVPPPKASFVPQGARADNDVQPAEANAADEPKAKKIDHRGDEIAPNGTLRTAKSQIGIGRSRSARAWGTANEYDDSSLTAPVDTNAKLRERQLFEDAASSVDEREESLLPPGSLSASELPMSSTQRASDSVGEPVTEMNGGARNALRPKTARDDGVASTSPAARRAAVQSSVIAPDVDSGWACEDDSRVPSESTEAIPAEKPDRETDKQSTCSSPLQSSIGLEATVPKPEFPPARSESAPAPLSSTSIENPSSTTIARSSPTSEFAQLQSAPVTPVTLLPTTLDERSLMPASLSPASTSLGTFRQPSDWLAECPTALAQLPTAAGSTAVAPCRCRLNPCRWPPTQLRRQRPLSLLLNSRRRESITPHPLRLRRHGHTDGYGTGSSGIRPLSQSPLLHFRHRRFQPVTNQLGHRTKQFRRARRKIGQKMHPRRTPPRSSARC